MTARFAVLFVEVRQNDTEPEPSEVAGLLYGLKDGRTQVFYKDEDGLVSRLTGDAFFKSIRVGGASGPTWSTGSEEPEGRIVGDPGDIYTRVAADGQSAQMYLKAGAPGTSDSWARFA